MKTGGKGGSINRRMGHITIAVVMVVVLVGYIGYVIGATTSTNPTGNQGTNIGVQSPGTYSGPTWTGNDQVVILMGSTDTALGTQSAAGGVNALAGTQTPLSTCVLASGTSGSCTFGFQPASGSPTGAEVTGDYAEELQFTATQTVAAPAIGFDMQIALSGGSLSSPQYAAVYANVGTCTPATGQTTCTATITMELYVDLGVPQSSTQPTIGHIVISMNNCASASTCP